MNRELVYYYRASVVVAITAFVVIGFLYPSEIGVSSIAFLCVLVVFSGMILILNRLEQLKERLENIEAKLDELTKKE